MMDFENLEKNQQDESAEELVEAAGSQNAPLDTASASEPEDSEPEDLDKSPDRSDARPKVASSFAAQKMFFDEDEEEFGFDEAEEDQEFDRETMAQMYDESLKDLKEGNTVTGIIIEVDDQSVLVDIGYKSEGVLRRSELEEGLFPVPAEIGQEVEVVLESIESQDGHVLLSKRRADRLRFWEDLKQRFQDNEPIDGTIISRKRGGYTVDIRGIKAFLPGSQLDLHPVRNMDEFVGKRYPMKILSLQVEGSHRNIVLSRRAVLEEDLKDRIEATLSKLQEGRIGEGIVKNITDWGVFVDLGGIDGLLHRTDISWGRTEHPSQYFHVGDELDVIILRFDRERNQVSLGYKQKTPDPWQHVEEKYYEGARLKGRVVSLKQYGGFVELEESVQGLLHVSEMSWTRRIEHPSQLISEDDIIDVVVLRVDAAERKISLGLKQLTDDPWMEIGDKYPIGSRVTGIVREISNIGCKVEVDEDIIGFLHRSNITWSRHMRHPADVLELGDSVELIVLEVNPEAHNLSLGLKQIKTDPWEGIEQELKQDMKITGRIINILDFGAFVEVRPGVEGLVHISEIANRRISHPSQVLKQDEDVKVKVLSVNEQEHRLSLSIRECLEDEDVRQEASSDVSSNAADTDQSLPDESQGAAVEKPTAEASDVSGPKAEKIAEQEPAPDESPTELDSAADVSSEPEPEPVSESPDEIRRDEAPDATDTAESQEHDEPKA